MSELNASLVRQLEQVRARISEIEQALPAISKLKSFQIDFQAARTEFQEFGAVAAEYRQLLATELRLADAVDRINGRSASAGGSYLASFEAPR